MSDTQPKATTESDNPNWLIRLRNRTSENITAGVGTISPDPPGFNDAPPATIASQDSGRWTFTPDDSGTVGTYSFRIGAQAAQISWNTAANSVVCQVSPTFECSVTPPNGNGTIKSEVIITESE